MKGQKISKLHYEFLYDKNEPMEILLASDVHFDNPKCNRKLFFAHLDRIKKKNGKAFIIGDLFCMMQGKYDPRRSKKDVLPEHNVANYIDAVIDDTVKQLEPYKDVIAFVSEGNHESAILKNLETNVLSRFVGAFNNAYKVNVVEGGYRGWIIIRYNFSSDKCINHKIYYHHGYGGGGEMTKGILQHSRMNMHIEGADAIVMGHVHESYVQNGKTEFFNESGQAYSPKIRTVYNIRTACYKEEFIEGGFHIEKGRSPKPLGGVHLSLQHIRTETTAHQLLPSYTIWTE